MKKYRMYTVEDFATDNHFRKWILRGGTVTEFWQFFLADSPEKMPELEEAAELVRLLQFKKEVSFNTPNVETELELALHTLDKKSNQTFIRSALKYAATALVFFFVANLFFFTNNSNETIHTTNFGEQQQIRLPDGSKVILNANSSISYAKKWNEQQIRGVTLDGEAFFEVVHQHNDSPFVVKARAFDVEVTGTSFNVINRTNKHQVVLEEGSVNIHLPENVTTFKPLLTAPQLEEIEKNGALQLHPNQLFETSLEEKKLIRREVNSKNYTAWLQNKFVCDHLPISELAQFIQNNYGWQVTIKDAHLEVQKINGIGRTKS